MKIVEDAITRALGGRMFEMLQDYEAGELPFQDYRVLFKAGERGSDNQPRDAYIEVYDELGYRVEMYNLDFTNSEEE